MAIEGQLNNRARRMNEGMIDSVSEPTAAAAAAAAAATELATTIPTMKRRKRLGKCARRRNQKARAIHEVSSSTVSSCDGDGLPSDREYTLEGVKVRRREWTAKLLKQEGRHHERCDRDAAIISVTTTSSIAATDDDIERVDVPLHPDDENALLSQLGYIPGNAICVVARISTSMVDAATLSTASYNHDSFKTTQNIVQSTLPLPLVVKLYPMAARHKYEGGKSDGRAFKGRRRGAMRLEVEENINDDKETRTENENGETTPQQCQHQELPSTGKSTRTKNGVQNDNIIIEPFPTLYWLTHPQLHSQISKLELSTDYNVSKMEERLRSSPLYLQQMERAHLSYGRKRWELLTLNDRDYALKRGWKSALDDSRGVAGIRLYKGDEGNKCTNSIISDDEDYTERTANKSTTVTTKKKKDGYWRSNGFDCVKCLHAHVAHYLAQISEWEEGLIKGQEVEGARKQEEVVSKASDEVGGGGGCVDAAAESRSSNPPYSHLTTAIATAKQPAPAPMTKKDCDWDDLNLIGKWVMEVVNNGWGNEMEQDVGQRILSDLS